MTAPLTPVASESDSGIVENCPVCKVVKWTHARCYHGYTLLTPAEEKTPKEVVVARHRGRSKK